MTQLNEKIIYIDRIKVVYRTPDYVWLAVGFQFLAIAILVAIIATAK